MLQQPSSGVGAEIAFSSGRRAPSKGSPESITLSMPGEPQRMRTLQRPLKHRLDSPVPPAVLWGPRRSSECAFGKGSHKDCSRRREHPHQELHQPLVSGFSLNKIILSQAALGLEGALKFIQFQPSTRKSLV